jgi:hypothetical protein
MKIRGWKEMMVPEEGEKETQVRTEEEKVGAKVTMDVLKKRRGIRGTYVTNCRTSR